MPQPRWSSKQWEAEGRRALLDLLEDRLVVPWGEAEARISGGRWKDFRPVQPLQLGAARRQLVADELICEDATRTEPPVVTVRLPATAGTKRRMERLRGARRKLYRRYLSWTQEQNLCGTAAERIVLASLHEAASRAGLWVPEQTVGRITDVLGTPIPEGRTLDVLGHILDLSNPSSGAPLVIEVKNISDWVYPWSKPLWELLVKAAGVALHQPVLPVLVCPHAASITYNLAKDTGFFIIQTRKQLFSPAIKETEFSEVIDEFDLAIERHEGPRQQVTAFLTRTMRDPPPQPAAPPPEDIPWYLRAVHRFSRIAPAILAYESLAGTLEDDQRPQVFRGYKARASTLRDWYYLGGY